MIDGQRVRHLLKTIYGMGRAQSERKAVTDLWRQATQRTGNVLTKYRRKSNTPGDKRGALKTEVKKERREPQLRKGGKRHLWRCGQKLLPRVKNAMLAASVSSSDRHYSVDTP